MPSLADLTYGLKAADAAGNAGDAKQFADAIRAMQAPPPDVSNDTPYSAVDWKTGATDRTPGTDYSPGAGMQFVGGFNRGLGRFAKGPEALISKGLEAVGVGQGGTPVSDWLENANPGAPQGALQRFTNRAGQTVGSTVPYAAAAFAGAPAVLGAAESAAAPAITGAASDAGTANAIVGNMARGIVQAPGKAALGEAAGTLGSGASAGTVAAASDYPGQHPELEGLAEAAGPLAAIGGVSAAKGAFDKLWSPFSNAAATRVATDKISSLMGRALGPDEQSGIARGQDLSTAMPGLNLSVGEQTGEPDLLATQAELESKGGPALRSAARDRYKSNLAAIQSYNDTNAPKLPDGTSPQTVVDAVSGKVQNLSGAVGAQQADLAAAAGDQAAKLPTNIDLESGAAIRQRELDLRKQVRGQMTTLADNLGVNNVKLPVPVGGLQDKVQNLVDTEGGDFDDVANRPKVINDILSFGKQQQGDAASFEAQGYPPDVASKLATGASKLVKDPTTGNMVLTDVPGKASTNANIGDGTTIDSLFKLQSRINDDLRDASSGQNYSAKKVRMLAQTQQLVDDHVDDALHNVTDPALKANIDQFRSAYKTDYIDRFNQGVAYKVRASNGSNYYQTPDERVAQAFWGTPSGARQFNTTFQGDPTATQALTNSVLDDLRFKAAPNGSIDPALFARWQRNNAENLRDLPDVQKAVSDIGTATDAIAVRNATLTARQNAIDNSALAKTLSSIDGDPTLLAASAVQDPKVMNQVMGRIRDNPDLQVAWRRMLWDHVSSLQDPDAFQSALASPAVQKAMPPEQVKALQNILDASKAVATVGPPPGSPLSMDPYDYARNATGNSIESLVSKLWAREQGRVGTPFLAINVLGGITRTQQRAAFTTLMRGALYDPKVAVALSKNMQSQNPMGASTMKLRSYLFNAGYDAASGAYDDNQ